MNYKRIVCTLHIYAVFGSGFGVINDAVAKFYKIGHWQTRTQYRSEFHILPIRKTKKKKLEINACIHNNNLAASRDAIVQFHSFTCMVRWYRVSTSNDRQYNGLCPCIVCAASLGNESTFPWFAHWSRLVVYGSAPLPLYAKAISDWRRINE